MAANPLPILALAAGAFFLMKKKDDSKSTAEPKPNGNGNGNGTKPDSSNGKDDSSTDPAEPTDPKDKLPAEEDDHPGWSDYGDGVADVIAERQFNELNGTNPVEFKPNKQGDAVLITNINNAWNYEMRFPVDLAGSEGDFGEIHFVDGNLLWVSTAGARPLDELKLEGIPDPALPNQRVLLAWM
jgi:hypothetical protein